MDTYDDRDEEGDVLDIAFRTVVDRKDFSNAGFIDDIIRAGARLQPAEVKDRSIQPHAVRFWDSHIFKVVDGMLMIMKGPWDVFKDLGNYRHGNLPPTIFISYEPSSLALNCCGEVTIPPPKNPLGFIGEEVTFAFKPRLGTWNNRFAYSMMKCLEFLFQAPPQ